MQSFTYVIYLIWKGCGKFMGHDLEVVDTLVHVYEVYL